MTLLYRALVGALAVLLLGCADSDDSPEPGVVVHCAESEPFELFVADRSGNAIRRYDGLTGEALGSVEHGLPTYGGELDRPVDVAFDERGTLYVANFGPGSILRYEPGGQPEIFFFDTYVLEEPIALQWQDGELVVLGNDTWNLVRIDQDGELLAEFGQELLRYPIDMVLSGRKASVLTQPVPGSADTVQVWDLDSEELIDSFGDELVVQPRGIARDCVERTYVVGQDTLLSGATTDEVVRTPVAASAVKSFGMLQMGPDGWIYASTTDGIERLNPSTGEVELHVRIGSGGLEEPRGIAFRVR